MENLSTCQVICLCCLNGEAKQIPGTQALHICQELVLEFLAEGQMEGQLSENTDGVSSL